MNRPELPCERRAIMRITPLGFTALCIVLVSIPLLHRWLDFHSGRLAPASQIPTIPPTPTSNPQAWGELDLVDIEIEQPEEYVAFEPKARPATRWVFTATTPDEARSLLKGCGLPADQIAKLMTGSQIDSVPGATVLTPDDALVLSIAPEVRARIYQALGRWEANPRMVSPYHLPGPDLAGLLQRAGVSAAASDLVLKLCYDQHQNRFFSDPDIVLRQIENVDERLCLLKALTYQRAVLASVRLRPNTDLDKVLGYWTATPGVHAKDLRPLLEAIKKNPGGGSLALVYFLPDFARGRLYTSPMPTSEGDVKMDCHWSALNFLNSQPDSRFQDNDYSSNYIQSNCYQIGKPSICGDFVFLTNSKGEVIHSAVHIAGDLVFTKNGINFAQPWVIMRMENLIHVFTTTDGTPSVVYYRRKEN